MTAAADQMNRALKAIYLEVPEAVARDFSTVIRTRVLELEAALRGCLDVAEGRRREDAWKAIDEARAALGLPT